MSEQQAYYEAFRTGYWADPDPAFCRCRGRGWALSEVDTWHQCHIHYKGQRHPEDEPLSYDDIPAHQRCDFDVWPNDASGCQVPGSARCARMSDPIFDDLNIPF